jgi:hypothetical protein
VFKYPRIVPPTRKNIIFVFTKEIAPLEVLTPRYKKRRPKKVNPNVNACDIVTNLSCELSKIIVLGMMPRIPIRNIRKAAK